jgi:hypothetical protein
VVLVVVGRKHFGPRGRVVIMEEVRPTAHRIDLGHTGTGMSNYLWVIDAAFSELLRTEKYFGHHAGRDFNGDVWYQDGVFHESVYVNHQFVAHYTADSLGELMSTVNDHHGWS